LNDTNEALQKEIRRRTEMEAELRRSWEYFRLIVEAAPVGVIMTNREGRITLANEQACATFGYTLEELVGQTLEILAPERFRAEHKALREQFLNETLQRRMGRGREVTGMRKDGVEIAVEIDLTNLLSDAGSFVMASIVDVTERKRQMNALRELNETLERRVEERTRAVTASLAEKEALLREIHHRVKNNMQIISSILRLQSRYLKDPELQEVFHDCQGRIRTMALIHEMLYQSKGLARIDFKAYLESLAGMLLRSQTNRSLTLRHQFDIERLELTMDVAIPVGLIANELLTNCLKHAFAGREKGLVRLALKSHNASQLLLTIADDGCGLPPDFALEKSTSLGLRLVRILTDQIKGQMEWKNAGGAEFVLTFHDRPAAPTPSP